jgi:hypothetical protein
MRECNTCHQVGTRGFAPYGDYGWVCSNEQACARRTVARAKSQRRERTEGRKAFSR